MDYLVNHLPESNRFEVVLEGLICELIYKRTEETLNFNHTGVPKSLEGRGIAAAMVREGLLYARAAGMKVIPSCPYVAAYINRHPEFQDLLK